MNARRGSPRIDHLIYAVPDLERGMEAVERLLRVRPVPGGRHADYGTRNALVALGSELYLEVLAPDPELPAPARGRLFGVDTLEAPRLATWVVRTEGIEASAARARSRGVALGPVSEGSRERPDGTRLEWRLTDPYALPLDGVVPFLIDWGDAAHPAGSLPEGGELVRLTLRHPSPDSVREALEALGVGSVERAAAELPTTARSAGPAVAVERADRAGLVATIRTASGLVELD